MMRDFKIKQLTHHRLNLLDSRIAKFQYSFTINANKVIVLLERIRFFELRKILTKLMLGYEIACKQMFNGIVNGSSANPVFFIFHVDIK